MVAITPVVAAGGNYRAISDTASRNVALSALVKPDGTAYTIVNGDLLLVWVFYSGTSTTNTVTGLTGLAKLTDNGGSGTSSIYVKQNCQAADASATLTVATSASNRTNVLLVVLKNVPTTGPWNLGFAGNAAASTAFGNTPSVVPSSIGGITLELAMWSGSTQPTDVPHADVAGGLTELVTEGSSGTIPGHVGCMSGGSLASGTCAGNLGYNPLPSTTVNAVGGTKWTPFVQAPNGSKNSLTIVIAPTVVSDTNKPSSIISSTGYSNVGGAADILSALVDELDTTFAETSDDPVSLTLECKFPLLAVQNRVGLRSRLQAAQTGSVTYVISIYCGATLICTKTLVVAVTDGVVADELLSSPAQAATVTDWSDLRGRYVLTKV